MPFDGLRVLSLESRRSKDIESLIARYGGVPFVAPSVKERAIEDHADSIRFVERLENGEFDLVVCMTGVGLAFLRDVVSTQMSISRLSAALRGVIIVCRGPKPVPILRALQVPVEIVVPEPNTWKEVVAAIAPRPERRIAIQEYGRPNPALNTALEALGAIVTPVAIYRWELPVDLEPLRGAVSGIVAGEFDLIVFTSSIQLDHLLEIAREAGSEDDVLEALRTRVAIASVGPIMTEALVAHGLPPDIEPRSPKMGALIVAAAQEARIAIRRKRESLGAPSRKSADSE
jgi:uroporphyrinogen-III synthase